MNFSKKRAGLLASIILVIVIISAAVMIKPGNEKSVLETGDAKNITVKKQPVKDDPAKTGKKFKSNDEIKKEYGKIETVYLWNGKTYTGAVINTSELYTIVTLDGVVKIPMNDVKLREIIR